MKLYLQMGHGMQQMCDSLINYWGEGTVIFSPVNIERTKLKSLATKYRVSGGQVLFDPQLYYPHDGADKLKEYDYWPDSNATITDTATHQRICRDILAINAEMETASIILPGVEMDIDAFDYGITWLTDSTHYFRNHTDKPLLATVCLYTEVLRSSHAIEELVDRLVQIDVDGYYIVARSSNDEYIISDANWVMGLAKLITCLKLSEKSVILAYTNHQGLIASLAHADALASGNYMNTRQFVPERFQSKKADIDRRRSNWYFHPFALTEYKADILDVAYNRGFLHSYAPLGNFQNPYSEMLFAGALPSSTQFNETRSFMHYLHCMRILCESLTLDSYDATKERFAFLLDNSEHKIREYATKGFRSQNRDFGVGIEALRIAAASIDEDYGLRLRLDWARL